MRVKVLVEFRDKFNPTRIYEPGTSADFDGERLDDLLARGLVAKEEAKTEVKPEVKTEEPKKKRK